MVQSSHMRKLVKIAGALLTLFLVIAAVLFFIGYFQKKGAGILVETTPASTVYINDEQVGRTPYEAVREAREVVVKLIPDSFEKPLAPYEIKVTLASNVQTVIKRDFGETENLSSGALISFEKVGNGETSISVISTPDATEVSIDGSVKGFTPYKTSAIPVGAHQLTLSAPGFEEKTLSIATLENYKLTAQVQLAPSSEVLSDTAQETPPPIEEPAKEEVEILNTGTGFLRVRSGPSTLETEVGQVEPGKRYVLLDTDKTTGWFKIEYEPAQGSSGAKTGWVTNQFAKKVEAGGSPVPSASPTSSPKPTP